MPLSINIIAKHVNISTKKSIGFKIFDLIVDTILSEEGSSNVQFDYNATSFYIRYVTTNDLSVAVSTLLFVLEKFNKKAKITVTKSNDAI